MAEVVSTVKKAEGDRLRPAKPLLAERLFAVLLTY